MDIKAAVLCAQSKKLNIETVQLTEELQPNEVLVKLVASGLCHTDISIINNGLFSPSPAILGHEGAGIVVKVGSNVTKVAIDDHVVLTPSNCGQCNFCKSGHPSYCENFLALNLGGKRLDGSCPYHNHQGEEVVGLFFGQSSFATYSLCSANNVVKISKEIPLDIAGPLGCGLQTGAGSVINVLKPKIGESIAVFGVGPVGLAAIMAAKVAGCTTIVAVDIHDSRLELALELGATHVINSSKENVSEYILSKIVLGGVHYTLDTTGRSEIINIAIESLRFMGKCVLVGVSSEPNLQISNTAFNMGKSLCYVIEGDSVPDIFIPQLIDLHLKGMFPFDRMIKFYALEEINEAIEDSKKGSVLKAVIKM